MHGESSRRLRGRRLQRLRDRVLSEEPLCIHCKAAGRIALAEELDHILPLEHGGTDARDNLQGLCKNCHQIKTAQDMGFKVKGCDESGMPTPYPNPH